MSIQESFQSASEWWWDSKLYRVHVFYPLSSLFSQVIFPFPCFCRCPSLSEAWNHLISSSGRHRGTFLYIVRLKSYYIWTNFVFCFFFTSFTRTSYVFCNMIFVYTWWRNGHKRRDHKMEYQTKKTPKPLTDCDHCRVSVGDELAALGLVSVELLLRTGSFHRHFQRPNVSLRGQQAHVSHYRRPAFEWTLQGTCLHILGPHEYVWNSTYLRINPPKVSAERGVKGAGGGQALLIVSETPASHTWKEIPQRAKNKCDQMNTWVKLCQRG